MTNIYNIFQICQHVGGTQTQDTAEVADAEDQGAAEEDAGEEDPAHMVCPAQCPALGA